MFEPLFKRVKPGDRADSSEYNKLVSSVEGLMRLDSPGGRMFGKNYNLQSKQHNILRCVLLEPLVASIQPLSSPVVGFALVLREVPPYFFDRPSALGSAGYHIQFVNRSFNTARHPGTFLKIEWEGEEWSEYWFDCDASEEGVQMVIDYNDETGGVLGGEGSGTYDTTMGGGGMGGGVTGG